MPDLRSMNDAQRKAVTHPGGPLLVLAGPGSGKTFTITGRILYLLEQGTAPERILVVTFTREAALSMQRRFCETAKFPQPVNFGTFHSIFFQILKQSNVLKSRELLSGSEKRDLIHPILKQYHEQAGDGESWDKIKEEGADFLSAASLYKNTLDPERASRKAPSGLKDHFMELFDLYQKKVRSCGKLDFDDMLSECRRWLLEDAELLKYWQGRFSHILIDEFQDINPVQYEVVKLLAGKNCSIFAVGDDDQSIYGFRGSEPECLRRFEREYGAERLLLDINYRSRAEIVNASLSVIGENRERFVKRLRPDPLKPDGDGKVCLLPFAECEDQYHYLVGRLERFLRENADRQDVECAVLFRTNSGMQKVALRLDAAGIGYVMGERMTSIYEHFIVRDVMAYLSLAAGDWSRELLLRVVNRPSRYVSREAVGDRGRSPGELRRYYITKTGMSEKAKKNILESLEHFERQLKVIGGLSPGLAVAYVQKAVGYEQYLGFLAGKDKAKLEEWQKILEWLKDDGARFSDLRKWQEAQKKYTEGLESRSVKPDSPIHLLTVHGSKGLEFDTVLLPDCNESVFPHGRLQGESEVEEERRIFYVAMTRAKECLELLYLTGSGERPRLPSRFLIPLLQNYSSTSSSNSQLSRYSSKASATFSYSSSSAI